ncbi:MAG TPA: hypothetical protein VE998_06790 [Terriglobales bacterium]|nr:hypothetical protein [Terriglobales bacterium]
MQRAACGSLANRLNLARSFLGTRQRAALVAQQRGRLAAAAIDAEKICQVRASLRVL